MFGFGKKKDVAVQPEVSKGYHSCVTTCERDIDNLETEIESLRSDNVKLISEVATLKVSNKDLAEDLSEKTDDLLASEAKVKDLEEEIETLENRLQEADEKADGTPVKYASARKILTKAKLKQLREALENVPSGASGFGGSVSVYDKKTKRVSLVEFKSKADALAVLDKAERGHVDIIL